MSLVSGNSYPKHKKVQLYRWTNSFSYLFKKDMGSKDEEDLDKLLSN